MANEWKFRDASWNSHALAICTLAAGKVMFFHAAKLLQARKSSPTCKIFTYPAGKVGVRAPWRFHGRDMEILKVRNLHFSGWKSEGFGWQKTFLRQQSLVKPLYFNN